MDSRNKIDKNVETISDCARLSKQIKKIINQKDGRIPVKKVAILSNFTLEGISECLTAKAFLNDIFIKTYKGQYAQWREEILGKDLYDFEPDIIYVILDIFGIDHDLLYSYHNLADKKSKKIIDEHLAEIYQLIDILKKKTSAKIVISNFPRPWYKVLGIIDSSFRGGLGRLITQANLELEDCYFDDKQVFVFDFDGWLGQIGKKDNWYSKYFFLADMRLSPEAIPVLAEELISYLIPLTAKTKKCLVLDLDNTLWGGIAGEDGIEGLKLSPTGVGQSFYLFQKLILSLYKKGIILAINSKNNPEDATQVFKEHPYMVLKEEHFAAAKINWQDKVLNLRELAEEINIGLDSMVFIDDEPANREMVRGALPEVAVIDLPNDPSQYYKTLSNYKGFSSFEYTPEDQGRGRMYLSEKKRREFKNKITDLDSFLRKLELKITIRPISSFSVPRVAQLTQKTNQFNLTTRRYQEEDIKNLQKRGAKIWTLEASDRFGDYGMTGVIIVKDNQANWEIDTLLLSCRILGKKIEEQFLGYILDQLKKTKPKAVIGKYIPTTKNVQTKDFYGQMGFQKTDSSETEEVWALNLKNYHGKKVI